MAGLVVIGSKLTAHLAADRIWLLTRSLSGFELLVGGEIHWLATGAAISEPSSRLHGMGGRLVGLRPELGGLSNYRAAALDFLIHMASVFFSSLRITFVPVKGNIFGVIVALDPNSF